VGFSEKLGSLLQQFDVLAHIALYRGDCGSPGLHWAVAMHGVKPHGLAGAPKRLTRNPGLPAHSEFLHRKKLFRCPQIWQAASPH
jgi:hypothetical protein